MRTLLPSTTFPIAFLFLEHLLRKGNFEYPAALRRIGEATESSAPETSRREFAVVAMASSHGSVAHLLPQAYKRMVSAWLEEDCPSFDYGGFVVGESMAEAKLLGKSPGMVAGVPFFDEVFRQLDCTYDLLTLTQLGLTLCQILF